MAYFMVCRQKKQVLDQTHGFLKHYAHCLSFSLDLGVYANAK